MPTDDDKFEKYLKQFCPMVPDPLPVERAATAPRRSWIVGAWIVATAAVALIAIVLHQGDRRASHEAVTHPVRVDLSQPLTMRTANALLNTAPSYKAVMDDMAFRSENSAIATGKQSAVAVLSKEKIKL